ncbi:glutathione S-transferase C-terminal domain-containing protein [Pseudovibrio sp. Tun.PSC04-5.I4]|uniref:glutathione S-transferase family protein n=1 Tax=Pseudovibrio sp. Tun.PSC04-5.I4 TaxID=1798213 RepID=UPI0008881855|nr:glutathione S-transferase C-terminal domain-containing protein [Pseudovibrio sp. Tun.PSC04-5.I4]SDQ18186.1 Glutathione S-transferase [Pseudovibrio sp. Tun.PSC04-5.I4]
MTNYEIHGALGSPYSMKIRAAFRAKRLHHTWRLCAPMGPNSPTKHVKIPVIPVVKYPDGSWINDSTPLLLDLEKRGEGRSIVPSDPLLRFACYLIEDMADEWLVKAMFHYRWYYEEDKKIVPSWLLYDACLGLDKATIDAMGQQFAARQIGRMPKVGCTPETAPLIEASTNRMLQILEEAVLSKQHFLFGDMASMADAAIFGQLYQLKGDPTPSAMLRKNFPFVFRWLDHIDDASGFEGEWIENLTPVVIQLLKLAGDTYLPFLAANATAIDKGQATFTADLPEGFFTQDIFKYHKKCLERLRKEWSELSPEHRETLSEHLLGGTEVLDCALVQPTS